MGKLGKYWEEMPMWAKGVTGTLIVAAVAFGSWKAYKFIKRKKDERDDKSAVHDSNSELNHLGNIGVTPSYGNAQYATWANEIEQALDGCGDGFTTTAPIFGKMKNDADIHSLISTYGTRTIDKCGIGTGDFSGSLASTLAYKYSGVEGAVIGGSLKMINDIFKARGLTFRF